MTPQSPLSLALGNMNLVFVAGMPLIGKSTVARIAQSAHPDKVGIIDMSALIDQHIRDGTTLGRIFEEGKVAQLNGKLQPNDDAVSQAVCLELERLQKAGKDAVLMVGFPRNKAQSEAIIQSNIPYQLAWFIPADPNTIEINLERRAVEGRDDDKKMYKRQITYRHQTEPALRMLKAHRPNASHILKNGDGWTKKNVTEILGMVLDRRTDHFHQIVRRLDDARSAAGAFLRTLQQGLQPN